MLIRRPGQAWHALEPVLHDERALQTLLAQSPGLVPSAGPGELAVAANFRVGSMASVDLLGVGADGRLVLVECGRQEGPGRRPMGGAALGVAAALWRAPYDDLDRAFAGRAGVSLTEAVATLAQAGGMAWEEPAFRSAVEANLAEGRFQFVLAVDAISEEVRQVVAYLNAGARPGLSVVALGLRYLAEDDIEILLPTVFRGDTEMPAMATPRPAAEVTGARSSLLERPGRPVTPAAGSSPAPAAPPPSGDAGAASGNGQNEAALFRALEASCLPAAVEAVRRLYDFARERGQELQWGQGEHPSVTAVFDVGGAPVGVWSCYTDLKPSFVVNFEWLVPHVPAERLQRLADGLSRLQSVPERLAGLAEAGYRRRLALAVNAVLPQPGAAELITAAVEEFLQPAPAEASSGG